MEGNWTDTEVAILKSMTSWKEGIKKNKNSSKEKWVTTIKQSKSELSKKEESLHKVSNPETVFKIIKLKRTIYFKKTS